MKTRLELDAELRRLTGTSNVYYQPPASINMKYPAIVYSKNDIINSHANNSVFIQNTSYQITVVSQDPECEFVDIVSNMPTSRFVRNYTKDNLNHDVFTVFY